LAVRPKGGFFGIVAAAAALASPALAGIVFTPHLGEYMKLPRGFYFEGIVFYTPITRVFDDDGNRVGFNLDALRDERVDIVLNTYKFLWVTNPFRHTEIPFLRDHDWFLRVVGGVSSQRSTRGLVDNNRVFGLDSNAAGLIDLFPLAGIYSKDHFLGPVQWNSLAGAVAKVPIGSYRADSALNAGTNYWSLMPLYALHQTVAGRLFVDSIVSYQRNFENPRPAAGGLVPSEPADVLTAETNGAWKFSERFYLGAGATFAKSLGANVFDKVTIRNRDRPLPPTGTTFPDVLFVRPVPGRYRDHGVWFALANITAYYVYRASLVFDFGLYVPLAGKGSVFTVPFEFGTDPNGPFACCVDVKLPRVSEAAAINASPLFEFRLVYLPWAP
jgi:hypothetical protein